MDSGTRKITQSSTEIAIRSMEPLGVMDYVELEIIELFEWINETSNDLDFLFIQMYWEQRE